MGDFILSHDFIFYFSFFFYYFSPITSLPSFVYTSYLFSSFLSFIFPFSTHLPDIFHSTPTLLLSIYSFSLLPLKPEGDTQDVAKGPTPG